MTVLPAVAMAARRLADAGVDSARSDAEELAAHILGVRRSELVLADWSGDQQVAYGALVNSRAQRTPLQHLIGSVGFRRLVIAVGPGVFVPRPETESVVAAALDLMADVPNPLCVDLCSGSGAVALTLADELAAGATVHAVERSPEAHAWLVRNIAQLGLPVTAHLGDAADALPGLEGTLDLVASNPPYVEYGAELAPEVGDHDPSLALWGGEDGLDVVRLVVARAWLLLKPGGVLVYEHSDRQGTTAPSVARAAGFVDVVEHQDLTGRDRYVTARKPGGAAADG